jgi:type II secretory pathway component PulM
VAKSFDLKSYARRGAEVRLAELKQEMATIYGAFPDLRSGRATAPNGESSPASGRRRRRMSAAQRKAVGERMRNYWAERRKANK